MEVGVSLLLNPKLLNKNFIQLNKNLFVACCGQLWVRHMVCGRTCDGLYHFVFYLVNFGIPYGSRAIRPTLARHTGVQVPVVPAKVIM